MRVLNLFCGVGGASFGYAAAGCRVTGVDIVPQPHYPFPFVKANALDFPLEGFDLIHASPPCQGYSVSNWRQREYPMLIEPIRTRLQAGGAAYVIENVVGAPLLNPIRLCGLSFGLPIYRHRLFECSFTAETPEHRRHEWRSTSMGHSPRSEVKNNRIISVFGHNGSKEQFSKALGIDWAGNRAELAQAIPPAYTKYIAEQWLATASTPE